MSSKFNFLTFNGTIDFVNAKIKQKPVMIFSKSYSPEGKLVDRIFKSLNVKKDCIDICNIEKRQDCDLIETYLLKLSSRSLREVPVVFIDEKYFGGYNEVAWAHQSGKLEKLLDSNHLISHVVTPDNVQTDEVFNNTSSFSVL